MKTKFFKHIAIIATAVLLFPLGVSFGHALEQHEHKLCDNPSDTHIHEKHLDCNFYKFQLNPVVVFNVPNYEIWSFVLPQTQNFKIYEGVVLTSSTSVSLRGPPSLS